MKRYHTDPAGNTQHVMVKGSIREKLPPSLNIKSANLRVLDPIGQGTSSCNSVSIIISMIIIIQENLV